MSFTLAFDVTARFYSQAPQGFQLAGYDTGSDGIAWTAAMWQAHPGAVHIDQSQSTEVLEALAGLRPEQYAYAAAPAHHLTSDVLDVESGAVPVGSPLVPEWAKSAQGNYSAGTRPGQRVPSLYQSASNVTANVNALLKGGVTSGVGLFIADWTGTSAQGIAELAAAAGPFPVIGIQFKDDGNYDSDVFSTSWLDTVSGDGWVFGPVRSLSVRAGLTTFAVTFSSPGTPEKLAVGDYEIAVCRGGREDFGNVPQLDGYPVYVPKAANPQGYEGHGIPAKTEVTVGVRAIATNGSHAGPWVTGTLTTGS